MSNRLQLFVLATVYGCAGGPCTARIQVCDPDCTYWEVCNAKVEPARCIPKTCYAAFPDYNSATCGPLTFCSLPGGGRLDEFGNRVGDCTYGSGPCMSDSDCDDGVFCNGQERCQPTSIEGSGCTSGSAPCTEGQTCEEAAERCTATCPVAPDQDGDGVTSAACGGSDCDDSDPLRFPGNTEVCDVANRDEDCDPTTFGDRDTDGDGFVDDGCCNRGGDGALRCGSDCDDLDGNRHPFEAEVCNTVDDDCNGAIDEGVSLAGYLDSDGDGYGVGQATRTCPHQLGSGVAALANDCDDKNVAIVPGSIVCAGAQGTGVFVCLDGGFQPGKCLAGQVCSVQPNGTGVCH